MEYFLCAWNSSRLSTYDSELMTNISCFKVEQDSPIELSAMTEIDCWCNMVHTSDIYLLRQKTLRFLFKVIKEL